MKLTKELAIAIFEDENIQSINVEYSDGSVISGFVSNISLDPFDVTLCQHRVRRGDSPYHNIDFSESIKITLHYRDGSVKTFE